MKKGKEMFEAIEMHVEKMLAKCSEEERQQNLSLSKYEGRIRDALNRLREVVSSRRPVPTPKYEVFDEEV